MIAEGAKAPEFTLPDAEGKPVSLKDFRGKTVVLYFYPKDLTPGCTKEACDFRDAQARLRSRGAVVLGMSADPPKRHAKFRDKYNLNFPLLSDESKEVLKAYGVWGKKKFMGREFLGVKRATVVIDGKGVVRKVFPEVKVEGHVEEVLKNL